MARVRAGESFTAAVARERGLFAAAQREGIAAGASAGAPKGSNGSGEPTPMRRQYRRRERRLNEVLFPENSTSSGSYAPQMRTEGAAVAKKSKVSGSYVPAIPPPGMPTEGASVSQNSKGPSSCGPAMTPPGMQTEEAGVSQNSKGSGSCVSAMPAPEVRTEGAGIHQKSKGSGSCGLEMPPPGMRREGAGVPKKSTDSGSCGPAMPPPGMRMEGAGASHNHNSKGSGSCGRPMSPLRVRTAGAGVLELAVDTDALDCDVCFLPLKPPIFQCNNGHAVCSLCHDKLKATGKCHVCGVTTDGNSRCHAMERLAESIRFLCPNAAYGCTARLVYHDREGHWQKCPHLPCCCPDKACGFSGPMESLLDHFACVHGWPSFTTALASGHFNVSLHDGFNFLCAEDHASSSPGILFLLNVVRSPIGRAISMLCIDTRATNNGQGQFSKEPMECELTYSRHVSSKSNSTSDQLTVHYQRCKFRVALTDLSNGLPSTDDCFQFVVSNFALGEENKEKVQVEGRIFISSINLC